jgi:hypothetical protein
MLIFFSIRFNSPSFVLAQRPYDLLRTAPSNFTFSELPKLASLGLRTSCELHAHGAATPLKRAPSINTSSSLSPSSPPLPSLAAALISRSVAVSILAQTTALWFSDLSSLPQDSNRISSEPPHPSLAARQTLLFSTWPNSWSTSTQTRSATFVPSTFFPHSASVTLSPVPALLLWMSGNQLSGSVLKNHDIYSLPARSAFSHQCGIQQQFLYNQRVWTSRGAKPILQFRSTFLYLFL